MYKRNGLKSRFKRLIRISEEDMQYLKSLKSKKSLAGRLEEIIKNYKTNEYGTKSFI